MNISSKWEEENAYKNEIRDVIQKPLFLASILINQLMGDFVKFYHKGNGHEQYYDFL